MKHLLLLPIPLLFSLAYPDSVFYAMAVLAIAALAEEEPVKSFLKTLPAVVAFLAVAPPPDVVLLSLTAGAVASLFSAVAAGVAMIGMLSLGLRPETAPFYVLLLGAQLVMFYEPEAPS